MAVPETIPRARARTRALRFVPWGSAIEGPVDGWVGGYWSEGPLAIQSKRQVKGFA